MSRAGFHFQSRLRRSFRACPHGGADSLGFRFATPQARLRRLGATYLGPPSKPGQTNQGNRPEPR
jgi:hypothetical protein